MGGPYFEIAVERTRQDKKWGRPEDLPKDRTPEYWLAILMEELGELAEAIVELAAGGQGWEGTIKTELIETAAVAVSWLEWIAIQEEN